MNERYSTEFYKDGTVTLSSSLGISTSGNYSFVDSDSIRLDLSGMLGIAGAQVVDVAISGNTLTLIINGQSNEYIKVGKTQTNTPSRPIAQSNTHNQPVILTLRNISIDKPLSGCIAVFSQCGWVNDSEKDGWSTVYLELVLEGGNEDIFYVRPAYIQGTILDDHGYERLLSVLDPQANTTLTMAAMMGARTHLLAYASILDF